MNKHVRLGVGIVLAGIFLWLVARQLDIAQVRGIVGEAKVRWIVCAVVFFFLGYACRIERWRVMLIHDNETLRWRDCGYPYLASVAINNIFPFRAGDFLRAFGFSRQLNVNTSTSVASLFVERLLDLFMMVVFAGVGLLYFGGSYARLIGVGGGGLLLGGAVILVLLFFPSVSRRGTSSLIEIGFRFFGKFRSKALNIVGAVFNALDEVSNGRAMIRLIALSLLAWLAEGFVFWFIALSLPSVKYDLGAWLALVVGTFATVIPSTPGYIGTFDYFTATAMSAFGNSLSSSAAFAFLVHLVIWLPPTILGGTYLLVMSFRGKGTMRDFFNESKQEF